MERPTYAELVAMIDNLSTCLHDAMTGFDPKEMHMDPFLLTLDAKELVDHFANGQEV